MPPLDQTPTPTRFLKNIEESGLFDELQTNPFDQVLLVFDVLPLGLQYHVTIFSYNIYLKWFHILLDKHTRR